MSADLAQFLDGLLRSFGLIAYAVALGGIAFTAVVLRPWRTSQATPAGAVASSLRLAALGAAGTSVCILLQLAAKAQFIAAGMKLAPFPEFFRTQVFQVNVALAALAALTALATLWLRPRPDSSARWFALGLAALLLVLTGAWLTHGSARLEQRELLMSLTTVHRTAGMVWVGAAVHLVLLWRRGKRDGSAANFWPEA
ncbi:MAG: hypothetical protein EXR02_02995, partial [Rhodospirillales bacterium]|nr:hypothetical protein [Rhodospirillales bacterium]